MEIGERIVISHFLAPAPVFLKGESESSTTGENCKKGKRLQPQKMPTWSDFRKISSDDKKQCQMSLHFVAAF